MAAGGQSRGRRFYGWNIVAVVFVVDFIAVGFFFYSYGVFFKAMAADLGDGTRFGVSLGISLTNLVGAVLAPWLGRAVDVHSIKRIMLAGALTVGATFVLLSRIQTLWQFYLVLGSLMALGLGLMGGMASSKLVANWFQRQRGRAFGIATVGISLSGLAMPAAATWLIAWVGWRGAFLAYAAVTVAVVVPLVARFVVNRPEDMGLRPDGEPSEADGGAPPPGDEPVWRTRQIMASPNFWAIAACFSLTFATLSAVLTHLVPHADDLGIAPYPAAGLLSLAAGAGAVGKLVYGRLFDRLDARVAVWCSLGTQLAGVLWLQQGDTFAELVPGSLLFGFGMGGTIPLQGAVTGAAFGRLSFGKAMGLLRPVQMPVHVLGVPLAGWIYDVSGSYDVAFRVFVACYLAACLAALALRVPSGRDAFTPPAGIPGPPH